MKNSLGLISIFICLMFFSCGTETAIHTGHQNLKLSDTYESISSKIKNLEKAPENVSKSRGEGYSEYFSLSEPSFEIEGVTINPSSFYLFDEENKLTSLRLWFLCEQAKQDFDTDKVIKGLEKKSIKGLEALYKMENRTEKTDAYTKQLLLVYENGFPLIKYQISRN